MSDPKFKNIGNPLTRVVEECSEVIHEACKIDRFGWFSYHPDYPKITNMERIKREMEDVLNAFNDLDKHMRDLCKKYGDREK